MWFPSACGVGEMRMCSFLPGQVTSTDWEKYRLGNITNLQHAKHQGLLPGWDEFKAGQSRCWRWADQDSGSRAAKHPCMPVPVPPRSFLFGGRMAGTHSLRSRAQPGYVLPPQDTSAAPCSGIFLTAYLSQVPSFLTLFQ